MGWFECHGGDHSKQSNLFSFFLSQHSHLPHNPTRPKGKIKQKLQPDVPQTPLTEARNGLEDQCGACHHTFRMLFGVFFLAVKPFQQPPRSRMQASHGLDGWIRDRCHTCTIQAREPKQKQAMVDPGHTYCSPQPSFPRLPSEGL